MTANFLPTANFDNSAVAQKTEKTLKYWEKLVGAPGLEPGTR